MDLRLGCSLFGGLGCLLLSRAQGQRTHPFFPVAPTNTPKGRTLEEVDDLFAAKLPAWRFKAYETHGTVRLLADLENEKEVSVKQELAHEVEAHRSQ